MTDLRTTDEAKKGGSCMPAMLNKNLRSIIRFAVLAMALPVIITTACGTDMTTGSCCATNGTCSVTTQANCTGTFTANGTCSPNPCSETLLDGTFTAENDTDIVIIQNPCYTAPAPDHNKLIQTFNATAGKLVTCSVTGPTTTSRPRIEAIDFFDSAVADTGAAPTSQATTTTFTPAGNQLFGIRIEDCAPSGVGNYAILVTQAK
jgi:hypothetical protein